MIKMVATICRKPGMSVEDFQRYWLEVHGPLSTGVPGLIRYVQSHPVLHMYSADSAPAYDGVGELWFGSWAAYEVATESAGWRALQDDSTNFMDRSRTNFIPD